MSCPSFAPGTGAVLLVLLLVLLLSPPSSGVGEGAEEAETAAADDDEDEPCMEAPPSRLPLPPSGAANGLLQEEAGKGVPGADVPHPPPLLLVLLLLVLLLLVLLLLVLLLLLLPFPSSSCSNGFKRLKVGRLLDGSSGCQESAKGLVLGLEVEVGDALRVSSTFKGQPEESEPVDSDDVQESVEDASSSSSSSSVPALSGFRGGGDHAALASSSLRSIFVLEATAVRGFLLPPIAPSDSLVTHARSSPSTFSLSEYEKRRTSGSSMKLTLLSWLHHLTWTLTAAGVAPLSASSTPPLSTRFCGCSFSPPLSTAFPATPIPSPWEGDASMVVVVVRGFGLALGWPGGRGFLLATPSRVEQSRHAVSWHFRCPIGEMVEEAVAVTPLMRFGLAGDGEEEDGFAQNAADNGCEIVGTLLLELTWVLLSVSIVRFETFKLSAQ